MLVFLGVVVVLLVFQTDEYLKEKKKFAGGKKTQLNSWSICAAKWERKKMWKCEFPSTDV